MKIWIRIGAEQDGPRRPLPGRASASAKVRLLHPDRSLGARFLRPNSPLAFAREGSHCEGERSSVARPSRPRRISRKRFRQTGRAGGTRLSAALPNTQKSAPATRKWLNIEPFFAY